ncbi:MULTISPECIES: hypothetical protein [unclassified Burkholderia]|uniref:hypothetical protein n=1 Tax=unclassified Burkholderia TaxID=2613784 RepID=UPI000F913C3D|nr:MULTISPECIES: hypothetical protein [unclassified Burkholderia]RQS56408.1 hypothetical protein DID99_10495 [Burkholderia sp. Bp8986]
MLDIVHVHSATGFAMNRACSPTTQSDADAFVAMRGMGRRCHDGMRPAAPADLVSIARLQSPESHVAMPA